MRVVISIDALRSALSGNWVVFDKRGNVLDRQVPRDIGPAAFLVNEVTDALKVVEDGRVSGSADRSGMWHVDAVVLNEIVLRRLEGEMTVEELIDRVTEVGFAWQFSPTSAP